MTEFSYNLPQAIFSPLGADALYGRSSSEGWRHAHLNLAAATLAFASSSRHSNPSSFVPI